MALRQLGQVTNSTRNWIAPAGSSVFETADPAIARRYLMDETGAALEMCNAADGAADATSRILSEARNLAAAMRERSDRSSGLDSFMVEYDLSSREGVVLMCLAEALLRIPDTETADDLIADKLGDADFHEHLGRSRDLLVNVSTWGLLLSGRIVGDPGGDSGLGPIMSQMLARLGEPVIRAALRAAMRIMSEHFVMGETIEAAVTRAAKHPAYRYSFDMLGEAALTSRDADEYFEMYAHAITAIAGHGADSPLLAPGISVKLSALSQRFELAQRRHLERELVPRLRSLASMAVQANVMLTIDAEEADRLEPTLHAFAMTYRSLAPELDGHFGLAVQAYQKRGIAVIEWLARLAQETGPRIPVRLVKGAYWDTEIKLAQLRGLKEFPVFTRKASTDVSYQASARALLAAHRHLYSQFATHNPYTVAWIMHEGASTEFEFQRLHGMGEELYESLRETGDTHRICRVYAPVGAHERLLPYLVRRLLENGANTSFVNRFVDAELDVEDLIQDPVARTRSRDGQIPHPRIRLPRDLFGNARDNSPGVDLSDPTVLRELAAGLQAAAANKRSAAPIISGIVQPGERVTSCDPTHPVAPAGHVEFADSATMTRALERASDFFPKWNSTPAAERARVLRTAARLLERSQSQLVADCVIEAGRTVPDALAEVREAIDFLRYYAMSGEELYGDPAPLPGPTGERNTLRMTGRGVFVCISPWNFPIAIFTGQIAAALAAGNTVIAKPAEQTPLVAAAIVRLLAEAGLPPDAVQFVPGSGPVLGDTLLGDPRIAGVAFTGSGETAKTIERALARRDGSIAALIAETGGVNAMIVDSSALTEQVVRDAVVSAFNSAGQRCSALRILCIQRDVADDVIGMLIGRMRELVIGDPAEIETDVGPVIDHEAAKELQEYVNAHEAQILYRCRLDSNHESGCFVPPTLIELDCVAQLKREVFGPILHVVRFEREDIDAVVDSLNDIGYGLTLGVQSRVAAFAEHIAARARVGNVYVNRDMIGAVVGVQPFGGMGLSGTGPKAGGPNYLSRFGVEQTVTINTAAIGGNTDLLAMDELSAEEPSI